MQTTSKYIVMFAGIMNKILSLDIFVVLGRLTYGAYLLNPVIILLAYSLNYYVFCFNMATFVSIMKLLRSDNFDVILVSWNNVFAFQGIYGVTMIVCSFCASILLFAAIEMPFISLLRLYISARRRTKEACSNKLIWVVQLVNLWQGVTISSVEILKNILYLYDSDLWT